MIRRSLPPVSRPDARILILGSMPGALSLQEQQYYAQPRNAFWQIMDKLYGTGRAQPYEARLAALLDHHIALWDVLESCFRPGSLDADIRKGDAVANNFVTFFGANPGIDRVYLNGATATRLYERLVAPGLATAGLHFQVNRLPSTSPANAAMKLEDKIRIWQAALAPHTP